MEHQPKNPALQPIDGKPGFYQIPSMPELQPSCPIEVLKNRTPGANNWDDSWLQHQLGTLQTEVASTLILRAIQQCGQWAGVSVATVELLSGTQEGALSRLDSPEDTLPSLQKNGWIRILKNDKGRPVIFITGKLTRALPDK